MLYVPTLDGVHAFPFQVCVMVETVFHSAYCGSPVQFADCVSATHVEVEGFHV